MLGLAVGIDYALFIVNRHRRQLARGMELHESIGLANGTAGNAVVFAGATVLVALLGLNITGIPFLGIMGNVGALCVGVAVLIAVTLTPALLGLARNRVLTRRLLRRVAARHEETVTVIDLNSRVCPDGEFTWSIDGLRIRSDGLHFTEDGVREWIAPWLMPQLLRIAVNGP